MAGHHTTSIRLLEPYVGAALRRATFEELEPGVWYAEVEELPGVWAEGPDIPACSRALEAVVAEWVALKMRDDDRDLPVLDGIDLNHL